MTAEREDWNMVTTGFKNENSNGPTKWFVSSAGVILAVTGLIKVFSAFGDAKLLEMADPIIDIKLGVLMLLVGMAEIIIALICFFGKRPVFPIGVLAWLSTSFVIYRLNLWWIGWKKPCSCLGSLTDAVHIPPQTADMAMKIILAYLFIGSYSALCWHWRRKKSLAIN